MDLESILASKVAQVCLAEFWSKKTLKHHVIGHCSQLQKSENTQVYRGTHYELL
jgi:hypothetical protein